MISAPTYRSGELAKRAGVSTDTLRHYERLGLLPRPRRRENGYREYPGEALARVRLIRNALAIGLTLAELEPILRQRSMGKAPCRQVRALAGSRLKDVEARLVELAAFRDALAEVLRAWDARLEDVPAGVQAKLLESLPPATARPPLAFRGRAGVKR